MDILIWSNGIICLLSSGQYGYYVPNGLKPKCMLTLRDSRCYAEFGCKAKQYRAHRPAVNWIGCLRLPIQYIRSYLPC